MRFNFQTRRPALLCVLAAGIALLTGLRPAHADQSAVNFLQYYVNRATNKVRGEGQYGLKVSVVTNQPSLQVTYLESTDNHIGAVLSFAPSQIKKIGRWNWYVFPNSYQGDSRLYDSFVRYPPSNYLGWFVLSWYDYPYPFNPSPTRIANVYIDADNGTLTWTQDGRTTRADLKWVNGVLLAPLDNGATALVSVQEYYTPLIK